MNIRLNKFGVRSSALRLRSLRQAQHSAGTSQCEVINTAESKTIAKLTLVSS